MNPRLRPPGVSLDTDWPDIAHLAKYRVSGLVRLYGQKRAWIWRLWLRECRRPPKVWLEVMRWGAAVRLAPHMTTEAIARHLFYTDASHLTHEFRRFSGITLSRFRAEERLKAHQAYLAATLTRGGQPSFALYHQLRVGSPQLRSASL